eukprot:756430_1
MRLVAVIVMVMVPLLLQCCGVFAAGLTNVAKLEAQEEEITERAREIEQLQKSLTELAVDIAKMPFELEAIRTEVEAQRMIIRTREIHIQVLKAILANTPAAAKVKELQNEIEIMEKDKTFHVLKAALDESGTAAILHD